MKLRRLEGVEGIPWDRAGAAAGHSWGFLVEAYERTVEYDYIECRIRDVRVVGDRGCAK